MVEHLNMQLVELPGLRHDTRAFTATESGSIALAVIGGLITIGSGLQ